MSWLDRMNSSRATQEPGRSPRFRVRLNRSSTAAVMVVASALVLFCAVPIADAASTGTFKNYTVHVAPEAVLEGNSPTPVSLELTNEITSNTTFGSVAITVTESANIPVDSVVPPSGWSVSTTPPPGTILLVSKKSASIAPGGTLTVVFNITPSAAGTITLATEVKQSNNFSGTGNDFILDTSNSGSPYVEVVTSVTVAFDQQPTDVQQSDLSKHTFFGMCPPVSVLVSAPDGRPVGGVPVTVASNGTSDPGLIFSPASLSSGTTSASNGIATFGADCDSGIGATTLGSDYTLIATAATQSSAVRSAPSSPFAVVQLLITCTANPCDTPTITGQSGTQGSASISFGTPGYKVLGNFGGGSLVCDSEVTTIPADELDLQTTVGASGVVTMTFPKSVVNNLANNGTPLMQVCAGASEPFPGATDECSGTSGSSCPSPRYQGLLPDCPVDNVPAGNVDLCVLSRSKHAANEIITIFVSDLSDPSFW